MDTIKEYCGYDPVTLDMAFMEMEHPSRGMVMTYGGPFDSYTLCELDDDGDVVREHYDHDEGGWVLDEVESVCCGDCLDLILVRGRSCIRMFLQLARYENKKPLGGVASAMNCAEQRERFLTGLTGSTGSEDEPMGSVG